MMIPNMLKLIGNINTENNTDNRINPNNTVIINSSPCIIYKVITYDLKS